MATAGESSKWSDPVLSHEDDLAAAIALQLQELELERGSRKGKGREGEISDRYIALEEYQDLLLSMSQLHADQRMAKSIADAVNQDAAVIAELVAAEATALRDREYALQLEELAPRTESSSAPTSPGLRSTRSLTTDDTKSFSAFTNYEHETNFPKYILDNRFEGDMGSSTSRPQERAIQYYTAPKVDCSICFSAVPEGHSEQRPCGHVYCTKCLRSYVFKAMKDESLYPLKCCKVEIPSEVISKILSVSEYREYQKMEVEYATENRIYCPKKGCFQFIPPHAIRGEYNYAVCTHCSTLACTKCKGKWHVGPCAVDAGLEATIKTARQKGWRQCFKCKRMIELSHGCYHMTCHCKAEFCYVCGVEWKNCKCELFEEQRLYNNAAARVDQAAAAVPIAPALRAMRIVQAQQQIRNNQACEHPGGFQRRPELRREGYTCELCSARQCRYVLACQHCGLLVCEECRRFRV